MSSRIALGNVFLGLTLLLTACGPVAPVAPAPTASPPATVAAPAPVAAPSPTVALAPTLAPTPAASPVAVVPATEVFSGQRVLAQVEQLAGKIGPRVAGTEGAQKAADHLVQQLSSYGYAAQKVPFPFARFIDRGSDLRVVRPAAKELYPNTMMYSASGEVTAELVEAGIGRADEYPKEAAGKIALVRRGTITFREKVENAQRAGVVGLVVSNNQAGNFRGTLGENVRIPVVAITSDDGDELRGLLKQGSVVVRVFADTAVDHGSTENVVAERPAPGQPVVVIGAHYDSVESSPGANDNGSGTAAVLEVARVTAGRRYPFALRFILFGAEEIGLVGSRAYVNGLSAAERQNIVAMINLDMVGVGDQIGLAGTERLINLALAVANDQGLKASRREEALGRASDQAPFIAAGIPGVVLGWPDDPAYHSSLDKPANVRPERLEAAGRIVLGVLERLPR